MRGHVYRVRACAKSRPYASWILAVDCRWSGLLYWASYGEQWNFGPLTFAIIASLGTVILSGLGIKQLIKAATLGPRLTHMDAFPTIGLFVGAAVFLGLGIFVFVVSIKKMASSFQPDTSGGGSTNVSRLWLFVRLILGILLASVGGALLIAGIVRVTS